MLLYFMLSCTWMWWYVSHDESNGPHIHKVLRSALWRIPLLVLDVQQPPLSLVMLDINFSHTVAKGITRILKYK